MQATPLPAAETSASSRLLRLLGAFVLGGVGISLLREEWAKTETWPWLVLVAAMFMGASALRGLELWLPGEAILPRLAAYPSVRRRLIGLGCMVLALALTAWLVMRLWPDYHKWHGTPVAWIAAMLLMLAGAWLVGAVGHGAPRAAAAIRLWPDTRRNRWLELAAFSFILLLAIFLRTYRLDTIPPGIYVDETNGGLDALYISEGRDVSPFAAGWYGTPNGYLYYMAGVFRLFGANWYSLKLISLLPAILTIPAMYLLARQLFGPLPGLIAMLLLAVSRWHLSMSRWGWNETAPPLFQLLSFFFLVRGLRDRRAIDYALSGLLAALSQYTYLSARLAAGTLGLYIIYWLISEPSGLWPAIKRSWLGLTLLAVTAVVSAAPLLVTYITDPFTYGNRVNEISVFRDIKDQHSYTPLVANITDILKFFHQTGDLQGKHNLPGEPMADPFTGLLFAIGVGYAILGWRDQRRIMLLMWLLIGLAGSFLSSHHESPQSYRSLTALPAVAMLAADVLDRTARAALKWFKGSETLATPRLAWLGTGGLVLTALAAAAVWESSIYFGPQASSIDVLRGFNPTENGVARETISALQSGETVYLSPNFSTFAPMRFLLYGFYKAKYGKNTLDDRPYKLIVPEVNLPVPDDGHDVRILLDASYWPIRGFIASTYPAATMEMAALPDGSPNYMRVVLPHASVATLQGLNRDLTLQDGHHETVVVPGIGAAAGASQAIWFGAIRLEHGGQVEFRATGKLHVFVEGQEITGPHYLGRGIYSFRVVSDGAPPADTALSWRLGESDFVPVPPEALFHLSGQPHGLLGRYWNNGNWEGTPTFYQVTPFLMLAWPDEPPIVPGGPFTARFEGTLHIEQAGAYGFKVEADDGARLQIDGAVLGEGLTLGQPNNFEATADLATGDHPIEVDYVQQGGGSALRFYWRVPGQDWAPVPPDVLTPAKP